MIHVDQLTRRYGDFIAVDQVSFHIKPGEIIGLLGHNGAGKSTLMKMLTGYLEPSQGSIRIDGRDMQQQRGAIQALFGYLPENCPVYPDMRVIEFLDYQADLRRLSADQRPQLIQRAIRLTALQDKALAPIQTLSRGYRQRLGVALAILHRPKIVILDEPTNGLDPTQILQMRELIRTLAKESTVILSTHILQEVQAVCERVLIMRGGRLVVDERLDQLQNSGRLVFAVDQGPAQVRSHLSGLPQVVDYLGLQQGKHRYALGKGADAATLARMLVGAGCQLQELHHEQRTLESLFAEINQAPNMAVAQINGEENRHAA
ncbi:ABC transporter ATP-binding protein [Balneatrix alpica]|uniref:ABC transporter ATP-binding protein n=1 Tax=Balneatrix alpica TaxID=75684 RepID=A0ABV5ZEQ9_9GAMM|nr:ABC transporter ATP-binding protein [Balneatrix alpica]